MGRRGRPRKAGKRYPSGKLVPSVVRPSEWVDAQVKRYGQHYCWALGRAYASGLLGGEEGKDRLQGATRFVRLHQLFFGASVYVCPLNDTPRGSNVVRLDISDDQKRNREWLREVGTKMEQQGTRPYVEQLMSAVHTDTGPDWLDRMLDVVEWNACLPALNKQLEAKGIAPRDEKKHDPRDQMLLDAAIKALDVMAPPAKPLGILVEHY